MKKVQRFAASRRIGALAFGVVFAAAACRDSSKSASADSSLAKDLALAGQQTAQPTFQDTAIANAPKPAPLATKQPTPVPVQEPVKRPEPKHEVAAVPKPEPRPEQQRYYGRDSEPVPPGQSMPQSPTTSAAAPTPAPAQTASAPGPSGGAASIGAGTSLDLTGGSKVCSGTNMPGDKLVATVNSAVTGANGAVIPAGSNVVLEVAGVQPGQDAQSAKLLLRVRSVFVNDKMYNVDGNVTLLQPLEKTKVSSGDNDEKKKVIGGAIAGAILGQIIGHNTKGTVIGAAAGAATGAAVAKSGQGAQWQACLPQGAPMRLTLNAPLVLTT